MGPNRNGGRGNKNRDWSTRPKPGRGGGNKSGKGQGKDSKDGQDGGGAKQEVAAAGVSMSKANQAMLKDLLQELHIEECADGTGAGAAQDAASIQMVADCTAKVREELVKKCFHPRAVDSALVTAVEQAQLAGEFRSTFSENRRSLQARTLDLLLLALPDDQVPARYRPKKSEGAGGSHHGSKGGQPSANGAVQVKSAQQDVEESVARDTAAALCAAGFAAGAVKAVVGACGRDAWGALRQLSGAIRPERADAQAAMQAAGCWVGGLDDMRAEEMVAMEAILPPGSWEGVKPGSQRVVIQADSEGLPPGGRIAVEWCGRELYPFEPPAHISYTHPGLEFGGVAAVTRGLVGVAVEAAHAGEPSLFKLLTWAQDSGAKAVAAAEAKLGKTLSSTAGNHQQANSAPVQPPRAPSKASAPAKSPRPASAAASGAQVGSGAGIAASKSQTRPASASAPSLPPSPSPKLLQGALKASGVAAGGPSAPATAPTPAAAPANTATTPSISGQGRQAQSKQGQHKKGGQQGPQQQGHQQQGHQQQGHQPGQPWLGPGGEGSLTLSSSNGAASVVPRVQSSSNISISAASDTPSVQEQKQKQGIKAAVQEGVSAKTLEQQRAERAAAGHQAWCREMTANAPRRSSELSRALDTWRTAGDAKTAGMRAQRERLPAWSHRQQVVAMVRSSQVCVVSGETGCGKTTQVPQFLLDDAIDAGSGGLTNIVCTQPRRISATSVAQRIADERCEPLGRTVGYAIRMESSRSANTRLLLCTTGVLVRRLVDDPLLAGTTHVVVDEVHERSLDSDFLLTLLKDLLPRRPDLRLILMSATLNEGVFSSYFGGCPCTTIPGFTHPVKEFWLEDVLGLTRYEASPASDYARRPGPPPKTPAERAVKEAEVEAIAALAKKGYSDKVVRSMKILDQEKVNYDLLVAALAWVVEKGEAGAVLVFMPGLMEISRLHDACLAHPAIRTASGGGAYVLGMHSALSTAEQQTAFQRPPQGVRKIVIATNIAETSITIDDVVWVLDTGRVKENRYSPDTHMQALVECWVSRAAARQRRGRAGRVQPGHCLRLFSRFTHDSVMAEYQEPEILRVPLEGLALQVKLLRLGASADSGPPAPGADAPRPLTPAPAAPAGKPGGKGGKAGQQQPQRPGSAPVDSKGVKAAACGAGGAGGAKVGGVAGFLARSLEPPSSDAVQAALRELVAIGALDERGELTALGSHLALLPVDVRVGKMLVYGAMLGCLDPVSTIAAAMSSRTPFVSPLDKRAAADEAKASFGGRERSDHLAVLAAYNGWIEAKRKGRAAEREFLQVSFLSGRSLEMMSELKHQFRRLLWEAGFVGSATSGRRGGGGRRGAGPGSAYSGGGGRGGRAGGSTSTSTSGVEEEVVPAEDAHAGNLRLVRAVLVAGLYPQVAYVDAPPPSQHKADKGKGKGSKGGSGKPSGPPKLITQIPNASTGRLETQSVAVHPCSVNFGVTSFESPLLVYAERVQTSAVYLRDATMVTPYPVLLFGGPIQVQHAQGVAVVGGWLRLRCTPQVAVLWRELRGRLEALLAAKIASPDLDLWDAGEKLLGTVLHLLDSEQANTGQ